MNLDTKKVAGFMGDFRTIWLGLALMVGGAAWAGDLRWMQLAEANMIPVTIKMDALNDDIKELALEKKFETDPKKLKKLEAYIDYKKEARDALIQKFNLQSK